MKFLKYFVIVLLALTVIFFLAGIISPSFEYENKVIINRPVNEVFSYFTTPGNLKNWMEGLQRIEPISGVPLTAGSQYRLILLQKKDSMALTEEVTSFKPNEEFGFHLYDKVIDCNVKLTFAGNGSSTILTNHNRVQGQGLFFTSLLTLMRSGMKNNEQHIYERFKKAVEEGPMLSQALSIQFH